MKTFIKQFLQCGLTGWCTEIIFTSLQSFRKRDYSMKGTTSIWMFPIYGAAVFLRPLFSLCRKLNPFYRGVLYALFIFTGEFLSGKLLMKKGICPWDYSKSKWNICKVIRLDYVFFWSLAGLMFEHFLSDPKKKKVKQKTD